MKLMSLLLVLIAPLPFWMLGLPWCLGADQRRIRLAPLVGCAVAGLYAELAMIGGLSARAAVGVLALVSAWIAFARGRRQRLELVAGLHEWLPLYLVAVLAASVSPFPVLGDWSGDWLLLYQMGESVVQGDLPKTMLARPPLFGAATTPLWIVSNGLMSYQLMAAVASAAAATATLFFIDYFWPKSPRALLLPLLLSPFFLHHTAAAWAKLLAAALILAAIIEARRDNRAVSAAFFALSVAVHEGSIIWAPCVLVAHASGQRGWRGALRAVGPMAVAGLLIVGPLQIWIFAKYGLGAKIAGSPVITDRNETPFLTKTVLAVVTSFIGWGPAPNLARWLRHAHPASFSIASKEAYWLVTSWFTTLAGTLAGLLFPFVVVWRQLTGSPTLHRLMRPSITGAIGFAVIANALLTGFYSYEGTMQAALVPLALGLYGMFAGRLASLGATSSAAFRTMSLLMAVVGTLPWLLTNLGTSAGLWLSAGFRARMQVGSEGDYFRVLDNHLHPLGMAAFPEVPLLAVILLIVWILAERRRAIFRRQGNAG